MKKFLLYFVLIAFIAGLAMLAWGFWNAKNIRHWAASAAEIKSRHDVSARVGDIESRFDSSGGKKMDEIKAELAGFSADLDAVSKETGGAQAETEKLFAPRAARPARAELIDFYGRSNAQVKNIASVVKFMSQLFEVAVIFDRIKPDTTLADIRTMAAEAKTKSQEIDPNALPDEMKVPGNDLKAATDDFLDAIDQTAAGKIDGDDRLNASYADFSQKEQDFFSAAKKYFDSFGNPDLRKGKIENDLAVLGKIKFSVK